jgi:hypothetical protein
MLSPAVIGCGRPALFDCFYTTLSSNPGKEEQCFSSPSPSWGGSGGVYITLAFAHLAPALLVGDELVVLEVDKQRHPIGQGPAQPMPIRRLRLTAWPAQAIGGNGPELTSLVPEPISRLHFVPVCQGRKTPVTVDEG